MECLPAVIILLSLLLFFFCRVGVFFFLVANMIFGDLSAVELFIKERPIFMYVYFSGHHKRNLIVIILAYLPRLFGILVFS